MPDRSYETDPEFQFVSEYLMKVFQKIFFIAVYFAICLAPRSLAAQSMIPGSNEKLLEETKEQVRKQMSYQLNQYCEGSCEIVNVSVEIEEEASLDTELGFEAIAPNRSAPKSYVKFVEVEIQVDERITKANRDRLKAILLNHLRSVSTKAEVLWRPVRLPSIGKTSHSATFLKKQLESKIANAIQKVFQVYCPDTCLLAYIGIDGTQISLDEAAELPRSQMVSGENEQNIFRIDDINIEITMDESIDINRRAQILDVLKAKTRFATPLTINSSITKFPTTYAEERGVGDDPYGLEKLRRMLVMFRELAGTKEIISKTERDASVASETRNESELTRESRLEQSSKEQSELNQKSSSFGETSTTEQTGMDDYAVWGSFALIALLILIFILRYVQARKDAKMMTEAASQSQSQRPGATVGTPMQMMGPDGRIISIPDPVRSKEDDKMLTLRLKVEGLRAELVQSFSKQTQVARELFGRMLKEDGVEYTAQYLQIFGHMIVLELVEDPNLRRDLYALSEFYHKSKLTFTLEQEWDLLVDLKTRFTAAEIRVLSTKSDTKFDFLSKLDAAQIYKLIAEENMRVQTIVLTQLSRKRRLTVYDMYQGRAKIDLMDELSRADAIPREFLHNVAKALRRKVFSRPEFDTENIRSSDIIIDLLERSELNEQIGIMGNLMRKNPEAARGVMMKLVTVEILPYLKDGHLLELILGLDREDLVNFLAGTRDHIRQLLFSKAPGELVESWEEDLSMVGGVDNEKFSLVELKIFSKIRTLADNGVINLLDINQMIFQVEMPAPDVQDRIGGNLSRNAMVA